MKPKFILFLALASSFFACTKQNTFSDNKFILIDRYALTSPTKIYEFQGEHYSYCPSVIREGNNEHMFFCANPDSGVFVDNIFYLNTKATQAPKSVLQPSLEWDSRHVCDPCVVKGKFEMDGTTYKYAMFFLSNQIEYYYNEIGVAFSNDIAADNWVKYPEQLVKKPWTSQGDLPYSSTGKCWGVGQPSALSLDNEGKVLLTYTCGDLSGTRVMVSKLDLSDMSNPIVSTPYNMVKTGLMNLKGAQDYTCNCDFALCRNADTILMVRPVMPNPSDYPSYISSVLEIDMMSYSDFKNNLGTWERVARIDPLLSGFPRNHNACIVRDEYGYVEDWKTPEVYYTVSKASPETEAEDHKHAEWTYAIYSTKRVSVK